jgi:hypothetical protein
MGGQLSKLDEVSLVVRNFGDGLVFEDVLHDWFRFLGGKPGEVVVVDSGSNAETQAAYWKLFQEGLIDKLQIIQPTHEENNHERGYIQIYTAGSIALSLTCYGSILIPCPTERVTTIGWKSLSIILSVTTFLRSVVRLTFPRNIMMLGQDGTSATSAV